MLMLSSSLPYPHLIHQYKCYIIASDQAFSISSSITLRWLHSALIHSGSALWVVGRPLYKAFADLRRHYGDINCIKVGFKDVVVIHGYRNVQRALVSEGKKFSNRPDITWTQLTQRHGETERAYMVDVVISSRLTPRFSLITYTAVLRFRDSNSMCLYVFFF